MTNYSTPTVTADFEKSTNLSKAEYDPSMQILTLHFRKGGVYDYIKVDREIYDGLLEAKSAGKYFHTIIKGKYDFLRRDSKKDPEKATKTFDERLSHNVK